MMIVILAAALTAAPSTESQARYDACVKQVDTDAAKALSDATAWRDGGGSVLARACIGMALAKQEQWSAAEVAFEQAAKESEIHMDGHAAALWSQAGNAALAADDPAEARSDLDRALAQGAGDSAFQAEVLVDRARAAVASNDPKAARADLDTALKLAPSDATVWLFSATLARRDGNLDRAEREIQRAGALDPTDDAIKAEAATIADARHPAPKQP